MDLSKCALSWTALTAATALVDLTVAYAPQLPPQRGATSYTPIDIKELFQTFMARMNTAQPAGATMTRGKASLAKFRGTGGLLRIPYLILG
jgi:hypothetical protein